jgi:hypothetical protein
MLYTERHEKYKVGSELQTRNADSYGFIRHLSMTHITIEWYHGAIDCKETYLISWLDSQIKKGRFKLVP